MPALFWSRLWVSHGGATAEGQKKILTAYGLTEERLGAPIRSSMEVLEIGRSSLGFPVFLDREAAAADHIVVVNRVKPHTDFEAPLESGLMKMMAIGLGKQVGADLYHNAVLHYGYFETILAAARVVLEKAPILLGLGLVENQKDETEIIRAAWKEDLEATDRMLLSQAKRLIPKLPFPEIDLLIVDEMGKDISGTGMDQNVIARTVIRVGAAPDFPKIRRIFVRDMTPNSHGTATGIGNADFTTSRLVNKIDRDSTYQNCLSACEPEMAAIPPWYDTDREVLVQAMRTIGLVAPPEAKIVHIKNTLALEEMRISETMMPEAGNIDGLEILATPEPLEFDREGNLVFTWDWDAV